MKYQNVFQKNQKKNYLKYQGVDRKRYRYKIKKDQFDIVKNLLEEKCNKIFKDYVDEFNYEKELAIDLGTFYNNKILLLGIDTITYEILKTVCCQNK